ncbi:MAG TPA: DUF3540 domain-containing protein [Burkholderiaceae bacterium]|jgi:hypothetical protein
MNPSDLQNAEEASALLSLQFVARLFRHPTLAGALSAADPFAARHAVRRALGCLIEPEDGDTAQLLLAGNTCWVLTVLERPDALAPLTLEAGTRALHVRARDLCIAAERELRLTAAHLHSRAELCMQHAGERHSHVEGADAIQAGSVQIHADQHMGLHSHSTVMTASALLKLDGGQIHMG